MTISVPIGVSVWPRPDVANDVGEVIGLATAAARAGVRSVWFGQKFDLDALTLAAVVGHAVPDIEVGTSVVPINPRHPLVVASQAQTAQAATGGRFRLGLGLGAPALESTAFGIYEDKPVRRLREYLVALRRAIEDGAVDVAGERVHARPPLPTRVRGGGDIPLLVAAMGPQALRASGELADGVLPFLAGPRTVESHIVPALERARPAHPVRPAQVIAGVVAVVTDRAEQVRATAARALSFYEQFDSYRAILDREGVPHAIDVALIGDEDHVARGLRAYVEAGATELLIHQSDLGGPDDQARTWKLLSELAA
ncbi:TIGR03564 family F420-dependent LLM class oxidoreductase [Nocardia spumae]|uniref:TIGR03564 family F420-dependent LLM class oxidoreductase n=1 Tax=Nocardia spumae TaxID=2887190 RepID=UPI001D1425EC|nr:TIGR03564 family F420-dependent LLM class oxidoreductase [Nocardia spumae]